MSASSGPRNFRFQLSCIALLDFFFVWPKPNDSLDFSEVFLLDHRQTLLNRFGTGIEQRFCGHGFFCLFVCVWMVIASSEMFADVVVRTQTMNFLSLTTPTTCWWCIDTIPLHEIFFFWAYYLPCSELDDFMVCMNFIEGKISTEIWSTERQP